MADSINGVPIESARATAQTDIQLGCGDSCPNTVRLKMSGVAGMLACVILKPTRVPFSAQEVVTLYVNGIPMDVANAKATVTHETDSDIKTCDEACGELPAAESRLAGLLKASGIETIHKEI